MGEPKNSGRVILLVEPLRSLTSLISSVLGREGYSILTANTPEEALELCGEVVGIDLLIAAVFLPAASGIELARKVRERHPAVKVLYLSSIPEEALRQQGIGDQAAVICKPLAITDLTSRVHELLQTNEAP